jgi:hypothetical protein
VRCVRWKIADYPYPWQQQVFGQNKHRVRRSRESTKVLFLQQAMFSAHGDPRHEFADGVGGVTLQKRTQLCRRQPHHAVMGARHWKPPDSTVLAIKHSSVPSHQTSLIQSLRLARNK